MRVLFPNDMLAPREADGLVIDEYQCAKESGLPVSLFSLEALPDFAPKPPLTESDMVLYRGWMMTPEEYAKLHGLVSAKGASMITSPEAYRRCHYLPEWYPLLQEMTPETHFFSEDEADQIGKRTMELGWEKYFIKDYVKSLSTGHGAVANGVEEVEIILAEMLKYRGRIEGGICMRQFVELKPDSERRFFVVRGEAFAADGSEVSPELQEVARRIESPFFSVDTAETASGQTLVIELGDGQVSDRKEWSPEALVTAYGKL